MQDFLLGILTIGNSDHQKESINRFNSSYYTKNLAGTRGVIVGRSLWVVTVKKLNVRTNLELFRGNMHMIIIALTSGDCGKFVMLKRVTLEVRE